MIFGITFFFVVFTNFAVDMQRGIVWDMMLSAVPLGVGIIPIDALLRSEMHALISRDW
jgi:hypothetical protein